MFQPISGQALDAESYGRLLLLVYGGAVPRSGYLPLTKGGIRLEQGLFDRVVHALERDSEARLEINDAGQPAWWQFWRKPVVTNPQQIGRAHV